MMMGTCFLCGRYCNCEVHHIFGGPFRKKSDRLGLTVTLCRECHNTPPNGVHFNRNTMLKVKQYGQRKAMTENAWSVEDFIREFGKNYL